jgi:hypothetical protein
VRYESKDGLRASTDNFLNGTRHSLLSAGVAWLLASPNILTATRRGLIATGAACLLTQGGGAAYAQKGPETAVTVLSPPIEPGVTLVSAPIELAGNWGHMLPNAADQVVDLMRHSCLDGVRLVSDRQPTRLRVDEHTTGSPAVWLHPDGSTTAWIIVDVGERAWSQLAYQFGHEFGHVMANSWQPHAKPAQPCQWLEEAIVESFSLRGLGNLAASWKQTPPFAGDNAYGDAILGYRQDIIERYGKLAAEQGTIQDFGAWFAGHRGEIEGGGGLNHFAQAASLIVLAEYERTPGCVEAVGALNRWPGRSAVPVAEYLHAWEASCVELQASPALPIYLREGLRIL